MHLNFAGKMMIAAVTSYVVAKHIESYHADEANEFLAKVRPHALAGDWNSFNVTIDALGSLGSFQESYDARCQVWCAIRGE